MIIDMNTGKIQDDRKWYQKAGDRIKNGFEWCKEHPQETVAIFGGITAATAGVNKIMHGVNRQITARHERYTKERFVYDHSTGQYLETNRKLKNDDIKRINTYRRNTGKKMNEALSDLGLLK